MSNFETSSKRNRSLFIRNGVFLIGLGISPMEWLDTLNLLQQLENTLAALISLSQHSRTRLADDLILGKGNHFTRHVGVPDTGFRGLQVFRSYINAPDCLF